jgi:ribosome biogenesis GTPase A
LEKKEEIMAGKESEFLNNLIKQKEVKKIWEAVRNILNKKDYLPTVTPENWIKHFSNLFSNAAGELLTYELQALGPQYVEELDKDFTEHESEEICNRYEKQ